MHGNLAVLWPAQSSQLPFDFTCHRRFADDETGRDRKIRVHPVAHNSLGTLQTGVQLRPVLVMAHAKEDQPVSRPPTICWEKRKKANELEIREDGDETLELHTNTG